MAVQNQTRRGVRHAEDAGPRASPAGPRRRTAAPPSPRLSSALGCDGAPPPAGSARRGGPRAGGWPCSSPRTRRASKASHTVSIQAGPRTIALTHFFLRFTEARLLNVLTLLGAPSEGATEGPAVPARDAVSRHGQAPVGSLLRLPPGALENRPASSDSTPRSGRAPEAVTRRRVISLPARRQSPSPIRTRGVGSPCGWSFTSETAAAARAVTPSVACFAAA